MGQHWTQYRQQTVEQPGAVKTLASDDHDRSLETTRKTWLTNQHNQHVSFSWRGTCGL
jgi:hypothetical protein